MPESEEHSNLVALLHSYITDRFCEGQGHRVITDSIGSESCIRPPPIEGYVPDAYIMLDELGRVVIGEAKSIGDLENSHTEAQVAAFLERCARVEDSAFLLAVPWPVERFARAFLTNLQVKEGLTNVETIVLSELSRLAEKSGQQG